MENLVGGMDPGGTSDHNTNSLAKSTKVDDLGTCGVQNSLSGLLFGFHMVC